MFAAPIHLGWRFYLNRKNCSYPADNRANSDQVCSEYWKPILKSVMQSIRHSCSDYLVRGQALAGIQECTGHTNEERDASLGPRLHGDDKPLFMQQGAGTFRKHHGIILREIPG
jgi:hypothetical protein